MCLWSPPSKHSLSGAEVLVEAKKRKVERIVESGEHKTASSTSSRESLSVLVVLSCLALSLCLQP